VKRGLRVFLAGAALIAIGNAVALTGVAYNRSGEPRAVIEFSQREFAQPYVSPVDRENSGIALVLNWRMPERGRRFAGGVPLDVSVPWLGRDKLIELGFDPAALDDEDRRREWGRTLPRPAWVVLELDGPAYREALALSEAALARVEALQAGQPDDAELRRSVEGARLQLERERHESSRLFAMDAGADRDELRRRYPDRSRQLILPVRIGLSGYEDKPQGFIAELGVSTVHVPLKHRAVIDSQGKYTVTLAFGRRDEPWIVDARAGTGGQGG
jgi:hypothetical protein